MEQGDPTWQRLGQLLIQRRTALNPRWNSRQAFADATGLKYRLIYDVEEAKRTNFGAPTLAAFESAYQLRQGAITAYLADGTPLDGERAADTPSLSVIPGDAEAGGNVFDLTEAKILRDIQASGDPLEVLIWTTKTMTLDERANLINGIRKKRAALNGARDVELLEGQRVPTEEGPAGRAGTV